jgi:NitT/TauT family transport system substrate-binding protein
LAVLRIGHLSTFYHTAVLLMAREDTGRRLGDDIKWTLFGTGPAIVKAFERKEIDLAYIGLPPATIGIDHGVAITCIAGGHIEGTVLSARDSYRGFPEIKELGDILGQFSGLKIGVPAKGSIHDVILMEYIEKYGLRKEIEVVNFQWADQITEAIVRNEVAAAVGTPALAVAVTRFAEGRVLYPPSKLWPYNPSYGILADRDFLKERREKAELFLELHEEATSFLREDPSGAAAVISDYVGFIDKEFVFDTLQLSPKYCAQLTDAYIAASMEFVKVLRKLGYISREIPQDDIFDLSLIRKIHPAKDHYEIKGHAGM